MEAAAVNLTAGDKPADVYSEIAVRYLRFSFNILT
jgi:DNA-directed RNA polymerase